MEAIKVLRKKKLVTPKLRFKEYDIEWGEARFETKVNSISSGKVKPAEDGNYLVYGSTGIIGKAIEYSHDGDYILVARVGANAGFINRVKGKFAVTDNTLVIDLKKGTDVSYCQAFLTKFNLNKLIFGSGQPLITGGLLKSIEFTFPSLSEQKKIASFLSAIDEKIQQLTRKKELLEQYKKGVMQQLFSGKLRFKDDNNGKAFPKWEEKLLGEIAERNSTKNRSNNVNFVLTNSATQGIVSQDEYFDREIANQNNLVGYYIVAVDDFVYNPRISVHAPVGPIKRNKLKEGVMSPLYSIFRFKEKNLEYFEFYFETKGWHVYLESVSNIGARHDRMNIANSDFFKMPIPFPCLDERKKITDFLIGLSLKIESVNKVLIQTKTFKKGLLQQMFV